MPSFDQFVDLFRRTFFLEQRELQESDRLIEDLRFDSLRYLELWVAFEQVAERELEPAAVVELLTVGDVFRLFCQLLGERGGVDR